MPDRRILDGLAALVMPCFVNDDLRCGLCERLPCRCDSIIIVVSDSLLGVLVGEQLGSVVLVMDYLQLDFSAARFTAYVWPAVTRDGVTKRFGDRGYRDALCAFIAEEVRSVEESYEAGLEINLSSGQSQRTPWRPIYVAPRLPS